MHVRIIYRCCCENFHNLYHLDLCLLVVLVAGCRRYWCLVVAAVDQIFRRYTFPLSLLLSPPVQSNPALPAGLSSHAALHFGHFVSLQFFFLMHFPSRSALCNGEQHFPGIYSEHLIILVMCISDKNNDDDGI